jgi:hypothetical protein
VTFARSWENIVVSSAGKAGIGIVTMDGAHIHDVHYRNITMSGTTTPIHVYIGARQRAPVKKVGAIFDIHLQDIIATDCKGAKGTWAATIDGQPVTCSMTCACANVAGVSLKRLGSTQL